MQTTFKYFLNILLTDIFTKYLVIQETFLQYEPEITKEKGSDQNKLHKFEDFKKMLK